MKDIYHQLLIALNNERIVQILILLFSTVISMFIYLVKFTKGSINDKQWYYFLLTTAIFLLIPDSFYTFVWEFIFN